MKEREICLIREFCHEADLLITSDPRAPNLDVLERARLRMNDLLWDGKYAEAEVMAYAILLRHSGDQGSQYLLDEVGDQ